MFRENLDTLYEMKIKMFYSFVMLEEWIRNGFVLFETTEFSKNIEVRNKIRFYIFLVTRTAYNFYLNEVHIRQTNVLQESEL